LLGKQQVSRYFANYSSTDDWLLALGFVDRRLACWYASRTIRVARHSILSS
jgi:hypothetical protein